MNLNDKEPPTVATPHDDDLSDGSDSSIGNAFFQENEIIESNNSYTKFKRCRYQCGMCAKIVTDRRLSIHHDRRHSSVPFSSDIYELYEINERSQCNLCKQQMDPQKIINHQRLKHPHIFQNNPIEPRRQSHLDVQNNNDVREMFPIDPHPYQLTFQDPYSSLVGPSILQTNNYEQAGDMNQHYVNVFISNAEYQRLAFHGRVYSDQSGHIFITDAM